MTTSNNRRNPVRRLPPKKYCDMMMVGGRSCRDEAVYYMINPDDKVAGQSCEDHALERLDYYINELGEPWGLDLIEG